MSQLYLSQPSNLSIPEKNASRLCQPLPPPFLLLPLLHPPLLSLRKNARHPEYKKKPLLLPFRPLQLEVFSVPPQQQIFSDPSLPLPLLLILFLLLIFLPQLHLPLLSRPYLFLYFQSLLNLSPTLLRSLLHFHLCLLQPLPSSISVLQCYQLQNSILLLIALLPSILTTPTSIPPEVTQPLATSSSKILPLKLSSSSSKIPRPALSLSTSLFSSANLVRPPTPRSPQGPSAEELREQKLREEEEERERKEAHEARIALVVSNIFVKWRYWAPVNRKRRERRQFEDFVNTFSESAYVASPRDSVAKLNGSPTFNTLKTKLKFSPFPPLPRVKDDAKATNEPFNLTKIIYANLEATNPAAKILFWKIVICTPTRPSKFVDWIAAKFTRGPTPALPEFPHTLALYHARDFYFDVPGGGEEMAGKDLKVCITHVRGLPSKNDLAGAQAILNVVDSEEGLVGMDNMRTISYLLSAPVPVAVLLFDFDFAQKRDKEWVQNMEQCVGDVRNSKKIREAKVIKMAERSDAELQEALKWLSAHSPAQPNLVRVDAGTLIDNLLAQQVAPLLTPYYSLSHPSSISSYGVNELVSPQDVIEAYNDLVSQVESQLTLDTDRGWSWPIPEFISTNAAYMPSVTWNKPETLVRIHNAFRGITMRALPQEYQSCVATQVFSVAPKSTTIPQLQAQAMASLCEATLQVLHIGSSQARTAAAPLIQSVQNLFTKQTNSARSNIDEITVFPWHRIFSLFFCHLVDTLTANELQIFSLAKNIPTAKRPARRKHASECMPLVESPRDDNDADDTPTLKRKLSSYDEVRQQKQKFSSPSPSSSFSPFRPPSYESMLAERFSTYVAQEREQSQMFDELMRDMIGFPPDDKQMADTLTQHQSDMDILMQELEREKSKYDHLEQQFHNLRS